MLPLRPSFARVVLLVVAACLTLSATTAYESTARQRGPRHEARTLRGGAHHQARLPGDERTRRLASVAPELRKTPHPEATIRVAAVPPPSFAPLPVVQSSDRSPARCRST